MGPVGRQDPFIGGEHPLKKQEALADAGVIHMTPISSIESLAFEAVQVAVESAG